MNKQLEELAKKLGGEVQQRPKGSVTLVFGGKKLAEMARKCKLDRQR